MGVTWGRAVEGAQQLKKSRGPGRLEVSFQRHLDRDVKMQNDKFWAEQYCCTSGIQKKKEIHLKRGLRKVSLDNRLERLWDGGGGPFGWKA